MSRKFKIMIALVVVLAMVSVYYLSTPPAWKTYPYNTEFPVMSFPGDENVHNDSTNEWWLFSYSGEDDDGNPLYIHYTLHTLNFVIVGLYYNGQYYTEEVHTPIRWPTFDKLDVYFKTGHANFSMKGDIETPFEYNLDFWHIFYTDSGSLELSGELRAVAKKPPIPFDVTRHPSIAPDNPALRQVVEDMNVYYLPKLDVSGELQINNQTVKTKGLASFEHLWTHGIPPLERELFIVNLDNGVDLIICPLARFSEDPSSTFKYMYVIEKNGGFTVTESVGVEYLGYWHPNDANLLKFSMGWRLVNPEYGMDITITPESVSQLTDYGIWEGTAGVSGEFDGKDVGGTAQVELALKHIPQ